ncbi:hypothetical protein U6B65_09455 [Oscillospiraceae bacterium MB08-C2-2]|nr:hypothetical protein U6B65_09455 [Oscillospiraceae bacterium MB08-C2-2]
MTRYILKRLLFMLLALFVIAALTAFLLRTMSRGASASRRALTPEVKAALSQKYKLEQPLLRCGANKEGL